MTTIADSQVELAAPTGREEAWRFTPLRQLRGIHDHLDAPSQANIATQIADGVRFDVVDTASCAPTSGPTDWASSLARAATNQSAVVTIPREFESSEPTVLTISGSGVEVTTVGHIVIKAEAFSKAVVVIEHTGSATYSENIDVHVGDGAQLTVLTVQAWNDDTVHLARQHAVVGRDATYRSFVASFGGHVVRIVPTVEYAAPGGSAELLGAFFADAGQHLEHRSLVDHSVPNCRSNVMYKGALKGDPDLGPAGVAHTVWVGDVIIRAAAVGTETYEVNRNLVLTDAARADSVPNLEIETGEIAGAGHASATGRFDDEQLFYLQSRGIPADVATRLVVRGFFADVIHRLGVPEWENRLASIIDTELGLTGTDDAGDDE
jgi:Fe-S cluster assembly protein SufD